MPLMNEIPFKVKYSPDGDDVDILAQRYNSFVIETFRILSLLGTFLASASEPLEEDRKAWGVWLDISDPLNAYLKIRNHDNTAWITVMKMDVHGGITPSKIKAIEDQGISIIGAGRDIERPAVGIEKRLYIALDIGNIYYDDGKTWSTIYAKNHIHNTIADKPVDIRGITSGQVLEWREELGKFIPVNNGGGDTATETQIQHIMSQLATLDIQRIENRMSTIERMSSDIALVMEAHSWMPEYTSMMIESFDTPDNIDNYNCFVITSIAGDDSIDVNDVSGIIKGAFYTLTDGSKSEKVQVKDVNVSGTIKRIILQDDIVNMYQQNLAKLYRNTAYITDGKAYGPATVNFMNWTPSIVWSGVNANTSIVVPLVTTTANFSNFTITGDIGFTVDGMVTLV